MQKATIDGKEVEVFTAEEVTARETAALEAYQKEHPDQTAALTTAQAEATQAKAALEAATAAGGDDKDKNFGALRAALKVAEDKAAAATATVQAEIEKVRNAPTEEYRVELVDVLSNKDATLKEKIEIRYRELAGMPSSTKAEVRARMEAAYKLAADRPVPGLLDGNVGGMGDRGNGGLPNSNNNGQENDNSKAIRGVLGISDEAATKYAPKPGQPGYRA